MSDFGLPVWPRLPGNALDLLNDALEDPNYDPNSDTPYKGLWRWDDGRIATPEEVKRAHPELSLVEAMSAEMTAEIDREVVAMLATSVANSGVDPGPFDEQSPPLPRNIEAAIAGTPASEEIKDVVRKIWAKSLP